MKQVDYQDWKRRRRERFAELAKIESRFAGRVAGNRPRDPEKEKILTRMDQDRRRRYIASGKLEIVSPRIWRYRISHPAESRAGRLQLHRE